MHLDEAAREVERLSGTEKSKALGVSNFMPAHFEIANTVIPLTTGQI
jgi:hypothetical protein